MDRLISEQFLQIYWNFLFKINAINQEFLWKICVLCRSLFLAINHNVLSKHHSIHRKFFWLMGWRNYRSSNVNLNAERYEYMIRNLFIPVLSISGFNTMTSHATQSGLCPVYSIKTFVERGIAHNCYLIERDYHLISITT